MPSRLVVDRCKVTIEESDLKKAIEHALKLHCWDTALPPSLLANILVGEIKRDATLETTYKRVETPPPAPQNGPYR